MRTPGIIVRYVPNSAFGDCTAFNASDRVLVALVYHEILRDVSHFPLRPGRTMDLPAGYRIADVSYDGPALRISSVGKSALAMARALAKEMDR